MTRKNLLTMLFLFIAGFAIKAQNITTQPAQQGGWWTIGINGGIAFQDGDVSTLLEGYGGGLTLAKNIFYRPGAPLSFDLRGRLLYTRTYGLDDFRSYGIDNNTALNGANNSAVAYTTETGGPGFVFQNHKTDIGELGLEGVITFNKLKERTNVIFSVFGGLNLDWYNTSIDQSNNAGLYSAGYSGIDTTLSRSQIRSTLKNSILDGDYETNADGFSDGGKLTWMPSLGVELGYQLTPRFSVGIGHKVTWARADNLDGQMWDQNNVATADNDRYHYTNLHLRWIVDPYKSKLRPPYITITAPEYSPYTNRKDRAIVRANIKNINSAMDVDFTVNNIPANFDFNKGRLYSNIQLQEGRNEVVIKATNAEGSDEESTIIVYNPVNSTPPNTTPPTTTVPSNPATPQGYKPTVRFINPATNGRRVNNDQYELRANIANINSFRDIAFYFNGREERNFDFNSRTNEFTAPVRLQTGDNSFRIIANNNAGSDRADASVIFEGRAERPTVSIYEPTANPTRTDRDAVRVKARIKNVEQRKDVVLKINGRKVTNFDFDPYRDEFTANVSLKDGNNDIRVEACNPAGDVASDEVRVIYTRPYQTPTTQRPIVNITSANRPQYNPKRPNECRTSITATIRNVDTKNDIEFKQNGRRISNFSFNSRTNVFSSTVNLIEGNNSFIIKANNRAGSAQDDTNIRGCESVQDTRKKPEVTITQPSSAYSNSNNKNATIKAKILYVDSKNDITFLLNGNKVNNFDYNTRTKILTKSVSLKTGNNAIVIEARNAVGRDDAKVTIKHVGEVIQTVRKPEINITAPRNNSTTDYANAIVKANIKNVSSKKDISFKHNGKTVTAFDYNPMRKEFEANVKLANGRNTFLIKATNSGGTDEESVRVNYEVRKEPPVVNITSPRNNSTTTSAKVDVVATIKHVARSSDVEFKVNGMGSSSFKLSGTKFTASVTLRKGKNTINIKGKNADGTDLKGVTITYNPPAAPVTKPTVRFTNPKRPGQTVKAESFELKAIVRNVASKNDIRLKLNGRNVSNFKYSPRSGVLSSPIKLNPGKNTIAIEASNKGGRANKSTNINYNRTIVNTNGGIKDPVKLQKPVISNVAFSQPVTDPFNPGSPKSKVTATITNIDNKNQITITHNGQNITAKSYDKNTKKFVASVPVTNGTDTIVIIVKNSVGEDRHQENLPF